MTSRPWSCLLVVLTLGLAVGPVAAQSPDVAVLASVEETTVGDEETVVYAIEVRGVSFADVETPSPPETEGLVLQQSIPSTRRDVQYVNGRLRQSVLYEWRYRPVRQGEARIGSAEVVVEGEPYRTEPIPLTVVPQAQRPQRQPASASRDPFAHLFGPPRTSPDPPADEDEPEAPEEPTLAPQDLFIRAIPSEAQAYLNEQVDIEYRLYFRSGIQLRQSRLADSWDAEGFWREELDVENRPIPHSVVEDGLRYNTITLKRVAVFPTRAGALEIDPLRIEAEASVSRSSRALSDRFFPSLGRYESVELASEPVEIEALPLPEGAPPSFRGAVGAFRLTSDVGETHVEVGEPVEIAVQISGTGNLATLEPPPLEAPAAFERYDPQVDLNISRRFQRVRGTKTFTYVLVPRESGTFRINPIVFSYFDPETEQYETLRTDPVRVEVTGMAAPELARSASSRLPSGEIAGLMTAPASWTQTDQTPLYRNLWTYALLLLPLLILGGLFAYRRHATRLETDVRYARSRRAHPVAQQHLKQAEALLREDRPRAFYEEIERAVLGFVGDRLNVAQRGLTRPQLDDRLAAAGVSEADRRALQALLDACDRARFAPHRPDHAEMEAAHEEAAALIVRFDGLLSRQPAAA